MKVRAVIKNIGTLEATNVSCDVSVLGGMLRMIKVFANDTLDTLGVQQEKTVTANKIFGFGNIDVTVTATASYANIATKTARGLVVGPLVIVRQ